MPQCKSQPKERYARQRAMRQGRRALASMTASTSHPQPQCALFSKLPAELRFQIYQLVLSQRADLTQPVDQYALYPMYWPGHTHHTHIDTRLLRTCRLVYCEAHAIPMRSYTHHVGNSMRPWLPHGAIKWLYHMSTQQGAHPYHLHSRFMDLQPCNFWRFLQPHLCWRRITWTVHVPFERDFPDMQEHSCFMGFLAQLVLPATCHEVNLELELKVQSMPSVTQLFDECRTLKLKRADGTALEVDQASSVRYTWKKVRLVQSESGSGSSTPTLDIGTRFHSQRLCWRDDIPRKVCTSYDFLDCLSIRAGPGEIDEIQPLL